jgi:hypothetical protein
MKKNITVKNQKKTTAKTKGKRRTATQQRLTVGIDLGDRTSRYCILDEVGEIASEGAVATTASGWNSIFGKMPASRIALEVGTHSPWVSRHLTALGHEVIVANPHKVKLITQSVRKNDRIDARQLARLARVDPKLLSPIRHRSAQAQADLGVIRARAELVEARTALINSVRGLVKPLGERLKACDADQVSEELGESLSETARSIVGGLLNSVELRFTLHLLIDSADFEACTLLSRVDSGILEQTSVLSIVRMCAEDSELLMAVDSIH